MAAAAVAEEFLKGLIAQVLSSPCDHPDRAGEHALCIKPDFVYCEACDAQAGSGTRERESYMASKKKKGGAAVADPPQADTPKPKKAKKTNPPISHARKWLEKAADQVAESNHPDEMRIPVTDYLNGLKRLSQQVGVVMDPQNPPPQDSIHAKVVAFGRSARLADEFLSGAFPSNGAGSHEDGEGNEDDDDDDANAAGL